MNKKNLNLAIVVGLFFSAGVVSAQTITNPLNSKDIQSLLTSAATQVGLLISSLGVIMIIVSGILYVTSAGNPQRVETAKKALIYAIAGIAIGVAASVIVAIVKGVIGVK